MTDLALTAAGHLPDAHAPVEARLRQAAKGFEGVFLRELFKGLENEDAEGGLVEDSAASQQYKQLFHGALSEEAAGGMGIADIVYKELSARLAADRKQAGAMEQRLRGVTHEPPASHPVHPAP